MIANSFVDRLIQAISWLSNRQWEKWEILTISMTALLVLVWITNRQRSRKVRKIYKNQFLESSPVIGMHLGVHNKSHHAIKDLQKGRLALFSKRQKQHSMETEKQSEKLHEEIKQLQYEIIKRKQVEVRLEQQVTELKAENEKLQRELAEGKPTEKRIIAAPNTDNLIKPEKSQPEQIEKIAEQQITIESAVEVPVNRKSARGSRSYEQHRRIVDGVNQKLCRECKEWKDVSEYHKNTSSKDGLTGSCKICKNKAAREYRRRRKTDKG